MSESDASYFATLMLSQNKRRTIRIYYKINKKNVLRSLSSGKNYETLKNIYWINYPYSEPNNIIDMFYYGRRIPKHKNP